MRFLLVALCLAAAAMGQPVIFDGGAVNSASYTPPGHVNSGLARGALIIVFGRNLGPERLVQAGYPLPMELAGTSVRIRSGNNITQALLVYASAGQIAAVLPSSTPVGSAELTVTAVGQTSNAVMIDVVQRNFGMFTLNQSGSGPAVAQ